MTSRAAKTAAAIAVAAVLATAQGHLLSAQARIKEVSGTCAADARK